MKTVKQFFDFYLHASLHVALAATALVNVTYVYAKQSVDIKMILFVFLSTVASYNLIKYGGYVWKNRKFSSYKKSLKAIIVLTTLSLLGSGYFFFYFTIPTQLLIGIVAFLNLLYVVPLKKGASNLRNLSGIKIYIVSLCWAIVTLLIPLAEDGFIWDLDLFIKFIQRFILTLLLLLIFEINDLKYDDIRLQTMPQAIGIGPTKIIIYVLGIFFFALDVLKKASYATQDFVNLILIGIVFLFTYFATPKRSEYYTLFWVEAVPVFWWILLCVFGTSIQINS